VITPSVAYQYTHVPTIPISNIKQIDDVDSIHRGNTATLSLSNKLQTKRKGASVDFVDLLVTTDYVIDPKTGDNGILTPHPGKSCMINFRISFLSSKYCRIPGCAWNPMSLLNIPTVQA
jgi:hypothetical protein